jgi:hypothetical protein
MTRILFLSTIAALAGSMSAEITPAPGAQRVNAVFNKADLVCNCIVRALRVTEERQVERGGRPLTTQHLIATVEITDLYKPERTKRTTLSVAFDRESPSTRTSLPVLQQGERAVMFLNATSLSYVFADPFLAAIPFDELPREPEETGPRKLQAALAAVLQLPNREDQLRAMELLQGFDELASDTMPALVSLSRSPDPEVALSAFAARLKGKNGETVTVDLLEDLNSYLNAYGGGSDSAALINIGSELHNLTDARTLPSVEALSASRFAVIRRGAMQSLRAMKNRNAAATLVPRLDDSDDYVRYLAVISLAEAFGKYGDYAPSMYLFDQNPGFYVGLWKSWWLTEGQTGTK